MKTSFNIINRCLILLVFISGFCHLPVVQAKNPLIKTINQYPEYTDTTRYIVGGKVMVDGNGLADNLVNHTISDPQVSSPGDPFVIVIVRGGKAVYMQRPDQFGNFKFRVELPGLYHVTIFSESWLRSAEIGQSNFQFDSTGMCKMFDYVQGGEYVGADYTIGSSQLRSGWAISSQGAADIIRMEGIGEMYVYPTNPQIATPLVKFGINHYPTAQARTQQVASSAFSSVPAEGFPVYQNYLSISGASSVLTQGSLSGSDPEDCPQGSCSAGRTFSVASTNTSTVLFYKYSDGIVRKIENEPFASFDPARLQIYGEPGAMQLSFNYSFVDAAGFQSPAVSYVINTDALPTLPLPEGSDTTSYIIGGRVMIDGNGENDGKVNHTPTDQHVSSPQDPFVAVLTWNDRGVYMQKTDEFGNFKFKADLPGAYRVVIFNESYLRHSELSEINFQFDSTRTFKMFDYIQDGRYVGTYFYAGESRLRSGWFHSSEGLGNNIYTDPDYPGEIDVYPTDPNVPTPLVKFGVNRYPSAQTKTQQVNSSAFSSVPAEGFPIYLNYLSISGASSMLTQGSLSGSDPEDCPQGSCLTGRTFSVSGHNASTVLFYKYADGNVRKLEYGSLIDFDPARLQIYGIPGATQLSFNYTFYDEAGFRSAAVPYVINTDALPQPSQSMRIYAGPIDYTTTDNRTFAADTYYQGKSRLIYAGFNAILNTDDPKLYETGRAGRAFSYQIPVANGTQKVVLHFAELYWGVENKSGTEGIGKRKFNVDIEGSRKLTNYDIFAQAGGALRPVQETFFVTVTDGMLSIIFLEGSASMPIICAIEVLPQQPQQQYVTLGPIADSYIRNGSFAADNYGQQPVLDAKKSDKDGFTRYTYLKFPLDNISSAATAKLRVYGSNVENINSVTLVAFGVTDDSWNETEINWNNAPASQAGVLGKININSHARYYEIDVTNFVQSELAGDKVVSFMLKAGQNDRVTLNSREDKYNPPQLIITNLPNTPSPAARMEVNTVPAAETSIFTSKVYPNPARKYLTIEPSGRHTGTINFQLTALNGQTYQINQPASGRKESKIQVELPSAYLSKGIYLLKIQSALHSEVVKVFITD